MSENRSITKRISDIVREHRGLVLVLIAAAVVWAFVFLGAAQDFLEGGLPPYRSTWNGYGEFTIFGYTVQYQFEGYLDYDYYYQSWSQNFLNGYVPYTDDFNTITIGSIEYETPYFLPPLFIYLCVLGAILPMQSLGLGFLITLLGYLTAIPTYGISTKLSMNPKVGAISAFTYLFNPLVVYHTAHQWLNPAPFVFFMMLSFYLLVTGRRTSGLMAMVAAALFKQIAFFLALPLIAYFIKKGPTDDEPGARDEKGRLVSDGLDLRGFLKNILMALLFVGAVSLPFLLDLSNYIYYIFERPGGVLLDDVTSLPDISVPITFTVLLIMVGAPQVLTELVNLLLYYTFPLLLGVCLALLLMLMEVKDSRDMNGYWRRMLFLTFLLLFWIHLFSPRGIYKYYLVALMPFFSIFAASRMIRGSKEKIPVSSFMLLNPLLLSVALLLPSRYVYLLILLVIFIGYLLHSKFSIVHGMADTGRKQIWHRLRDFHSKM